MNTGKRNSRTISTPDQTSFFDKPTAPMTGPDFASAIREGIADALAYAKENGAGDRYAVATEMSRVTGRDITKNMLDRYAAPSAEDWRFPLEALPALILATGDTRLVTLIAEACGFKAMPGEATAVAELVTLELQARAIKKRITTARRRLPQPALEWAEREAELRARKS